MRGHGRPGGGVDMSDDREWLDTMRASGFGRKPPTVADGIKKPRLTFYMSTVRLAFAVRKMDSAETLLTLAAIKDTAKPTLLERDWPALKEAYDKRKQYLHSISTTTNTEGNHENQDPQ